MIADSNTFKRILSVFRPAREWGLGALPGLLVAIQPLLRGQLPESDAVFHLYRQAQLERAVQYGRILPRWLSDFAFGYGYPLFNYYAPLGNYITLPLLWLGADVQTSLLISFALALLALTVGIYGWTRELFGRTAGVLGALCAGFAPYVLYNIYHRGALAESWGLACLALTAWGMVRLVRRSERGAWALTVLSYAGLVLSHNLTALIGTGLLLGYLVFLPEGEQPWRGWLRVGLALGLGLGLSAFFWMPAFLERDFVQYQIYTQPSFDYHNFFLTPKQLLTGPQPVDPAQANPPVPVGLGWLLPLLALSSWWPGSRRASRTDRIQRTVLTLAAGALALMALSSSLPIWEALGFLQLMQYPWRFLGPASLILAVLAGAGLSRLPIPNGFRLPLALLVVCGFGLPWLFIPAARPEPPLAPPDVIRFEERTGGVGATSARDFLPRWVPELPPFDSLLSEYEAAAPDYLISRLDPGSLPEGARVLSDDAGYDTAEVVVESPQPFTVRFRWYYFPGWQVWLDGVEQPAAPDGPYGLLSAAVPAGEHRVRIAFGTTPLRQGAEWISWASLLLCGMLAVGVRRWPSVSAGAMEEDPVSLRVLGVCAAIGLGLLGLKTFYLDTHDTGVHVQRFDGQQVQGAIPLHMRFGTELELMGYELFAAGGPADAPVPAALYWRALGPVSANYSVALHWVDAEGHLYGQEDHQHPGGYPTKFLRPEQYIQDFYVLRPWAGAPPGRYTLELSVYDSATARQLDVWDREGRWLGVTLPLTTVELTRPVHFPAVDALPITDTHRLNAPLGGNVQLVGLDELPAAVPVGEVVPINLYWRADDVPAGDYRARLRLISADAETAAESIAPPGKATYPTSAWAAGEIVREVRDFRIPAVRWGTADQPLVTGVYTLEVTLLDAAGAASRPPLPLGTFTVEAPERQFIAPVFAHPMGHRVGELATLLGYDLEPLAPTAGTPLTLTLFWRAETPTATAYSVFVHWVDGDHVIRAQQDHAPQNGARATPSWLPGEIVADTYSLMSAPDAPPGMYQVCVGMYNPRDNQRLPIRTSEGAEAGDYLCLPTAVQVDAP